MRISHQQQYRKGALAARDFLLRTQAELQLRRQFEPKVLRLEFAYLLKARPAEFQAGFLDALGAYMLTTLEGAVRGWVIWPNPKKAQKRQKAAPHKDSRSPDVPRAFGPKCAGLIHS